MSWVYRPPPRPRQRRRQLTPTLFSPFTGPQTTTGVLLARSPTFPAGAVNPGNINLTGVLLARSPTFPTGSLNATDTLTGVLLARSPTFPTGVVTPGNITLGGVLFTKSGTFPTGTISLSGGGQTITGILLARSPTFPIGSLLPFPAPSETGRSFGTLAADRGIDLGTSASGRSLVSAKTGKSPSSL